MNYNNALLETFHEDIQPTSRYRCLPCSHWFKHCQCRKFRWYKLRKITRCFLFVFLVTLFCIIGNEILNTYNAAHNYNAGNVI